jgi:hypothetical protein
MLYGCCGILCYMVAAACYAIWLLRHLLLQEAASMVRVQVDVVQLHDSLCELHGIALLRCRRVISALFHHFCDWFWLHYLLLLLLLLGLLLSCLLILSCTASSSDSSCKRAYGDTSKRGFEHLLFSALRSC